MVPFGGVFNLNDTARGMVGFGSNFDQLVNNIGQWRRANGVPIGLGFIDEVEDAVCRQYPNECHQTHPQLPNPEQRLNWRDVLHGTVVMVKQKLSGTPLVSDAEAERRAAICVGCKFNQHITYGCTGGCPELNNVIAAIVGAKRTSADDKLRGCGICHCSLRSAVYVDLSIQQSVLTKEQIDKFKVAKEINGCWKCPTD